MLMGDYNPYWWHRPPVQPGTGANSFSTTFSTRPVEQFHMTWDAAMRAAEKVRPEAATRPRVRSIRRIGPYRIWVMQYHPVTPFPWNG